MSCGHNTYDREGQSRILQRKHTLRQMEVKTDTSGLLKIDDWATLEFETPSFPAAYTSKAIARKYCRCLKRHHGYLELQIGRRWENKVDTTRISCKELLSR